MIKPTIGRVVWYYQNAAERRQPNAALIAYVHSDTMVNLAVFDANGLARSETSVYLYQGGDTAPGERFCEWMPYQQGQAAKTEALEKQLGATTKLGPMTGDILNEPTAHVIDTATSEEKRRGIFSK